MSFSFKDEINLKDAEQTRHGVPAPNYVWDWWREAPGPEYVGCAVRVTRFVDPDNIEVAILDPATGNTDLVNDVPVKLSDLNACWRGMPSTIDSPALSGAAVGSYAMLCFAETRLRSVLPDPMKIFGNATYYYKFPYGRGGWEAVVAALAALVAALQKDTQSPLGIEEYVVALPFLPLAAEFPRFPRFGDATYVPGVMVP